MSLPFFDFPPESFPITFTATDKRGEVVWTETVREPGAVFIPPLAQTFGEIEMRVEFADGTVE